MDCRAALAMTNPSLAMTAPLRHCEERKRRGNPRSPGPWIATGYALARPQAVAIHGGGLPRYTIIPLLLGSSGC